MHVMSTRDILERRKYTARIDEKTFEGIVNGNEYVRVPISDFFNSSEQLIVLFEISRS